VDQLEGQCVGDRDDLVDLPTLRRQTALGTPHTTDGQNMASSSKKKTTMGKLTRESRLRERRLDKQARKDARRHAAANPSEELGDSLAAATDEPTERAAGQPEPGGTATSPKAPAAPAPGS